METVNIGSGVVQSAIVSSGIWAAIGHSNKIITAAATLEVEILKASSEDPFHTVEKIQLEKQDALALEIDHFIQAVRGSKPPAISAREATQALAWVEKMVAQAEGRSH